MNENYELIWKKYANGTKSDAYLFKHKKSGARVLILKNDDDNKVFYVGFKTPPTDSTGVPHIMEHSTLCGSEKFPLKDPFVELAKGSLNTFLNAMTYPDKTVYPVASQNDKDFRNLMDVYMDAVFHPNVYKHPEIMKQEGWSYRIENKDDPIEYNGVVYNEMKGAFSSPDDALEREILNSLFPDNAYGVESGGDPEFIPDLTYEQFINFHKKYYHPANSYIYVYGDIDIDEQLAWMDENYLKDYEKIEIDSEILPQKAFEKMAVIHKPYPIMDDEEEQDNTYLAYNVVCNSCMDIKEAVAMQMIVYALVDTQGAPIRKRLLDEGIGKDIISGYDDGVLQTYFTISTKNANAEDEEKFLDIISCELEKAISEGISRKSLKASLNLIEFRFREADFGGYPKGLVYGLNCLTTWIFDDDKPLDAIEIEYVFDELKKEMNTDYYESLVKKYLLGNPHSSLIVLTPEKGLAARREAETAEKLAKFKASLSDAEIEKLIEETKALAAYQEEPSSKEALETIPLLERSDIRKNVRSVSNIETEAAGIPILHHNYNTNGIAYVSLMFNANMVTREELPYLSLLKSIVSFVDTENYSYSELNDEINLQTGSFGFDNGVNEKRNNSGQISLISDLTFRSLYENIGKAMDLAREVLLAGKYDDEKRLKEIVAELKSKLQMSLMSSGHAAAVIRANSYFDKMSAVKEIINGIEFYKFVENLEANFDTEKEKLSAMIKSIMNKIIRADGLMVCVTADEEGLNLVKTQIENLVNVLPGQGISHRKFNDFQYDFYGNGMTIEKKNEAFKTSGSVNYVARSGRYLKEGEEYSGAMNVFHTIMRYEYLWFNIRVQGGAYGCMCTSNPTGLTSFVTYRDPHVKRSNGIFEGVADYLENFECDEREMTKYVIGTMSNVDMPLSPQARGAHDTLIYLSGATDEQRQRAREEIIGCSVNDIRRLAPMMKNAMDGGYICCVGSEGQINTDKELFSSVSNLFN